MSEYIPDRAAVELFKENGPFFFSLLLAVLWLWTIKESLKLLNKPRSNRLTLFLLGSSAICLIGSLVVGWRAVDAWMRAQDLPYGRYASILGVPNDITIMADEDLYQKHQELSQSPSHTVRLAFFMKRQCSSKDKLLLLLNKRGMAKPDVFPIPCSQLTENWHEVTSFQFVVDEKTGNLVLVPWSPDSSASKGRNGAGLNLITSAYAVEPPIMSVRSQTVRDYSGAQIIDLQTMNEMAKILQSNLAPPGEKLEALGRLSVSPLVRDNLVSDEVNKDLLEPIYATLFDLGRHSDKQLAIKTRLFLEQAPVAKDIAALAARAPATQKVLDRIFDSMDAKDLEKLEKDMKTSGYPTRTITEAQAKRSANTSIFPIPTYTVDGDRFYVKAEWNNKDANTVQCIGGAYTKLWGGTLKQQIDLAKSRSSRVVYYTKDWAIEMFRHLEACGAKTAYVPWDQAAAPPVVRR